MELSPQYGEFSFIFSLYLPDYPTDDLKSQVYMSNNFWTEWL
jgi:hypothetical protein